MSETLRLEDLLNDLAVVRTTLEAANMFPADDSIHAEFFALIQDAKANLIASLSKICDGIQANLPVFPSAPPLDYAKFQALALEMIKKGYPGRNLNGMMKTNVFDISANPLYYFEEDFFDVEAAQQMSGHKFTLMVFHLLLQSAFDDTTYLDKRTFDCKVFQKYTAILFLCYATTDPMFYNIHRRLE